MKQLEFLDRYFCESSIRNLAEIFKTANASDDENTKKKLQEELLSVLQHEMSIGLDKWEISSSGNNHIIVQSNLCLFVNIYGANVLINNWLFFDGELRILNFHWVEDDNLVVFDVHFIVHDEWQKCICHFAHSDFFVYFTPIVKEDNRILNDNTYSFLP